MNRTEIEKLMTLSKAHIEAMKFDDLLRLFLDGRFEPYWQSEQETDQDIVIFAADRMWDAMNSIVDLAPLLESRLETCLYFGSKIILEEGERACLLTDQMLRLKTSEFYWVRHFVCVFVSQYTKENNLLLLRDFLSDESSFVRFDAISALMHVSEEKYLFFIENTPVAKITEDVEAKLRYISAFRSKDKLDLIELALSCEDEAVMQCHHTFS